MSIVVKLLLAVSARLLLVVPAFAVMMLIVPAFAVMMLIVLLILAMMCLYSRVVTRFTRCGHVTQCAAARAEAAGVVQGGVVQGGVVQGGVIQGMEDPSAQQLDDVDCENRNDQKVSG